MKKLFLLWMIALVTLPAALPWMPHEAVHALHVQHSNHYEKNSASEEAHQHGKPVGHADYAVESAHHPIEVDIVTYFNDYLHVDLHHPDQPVLIGPLPDAQDKDLDATIGYWLPKRFELASTQNRAPPNWQRTTPNPTPIYLSTQRLRI